jgi:hypothetical protein
MNLNKDSLIHRHSDTVSVNWMNANYNRDDTNAIRFCYVWKLRTQETKKLNLVQLNFFNLIVCGYYSLTLRCRINYTDFMTGEACKRKRSWSTKVLSLHSLGRTEETHETDLRQPVLGRNSNWIILANVNATSHRSVQVCHLTHRII